MPTRTIAICTDRERSADAGADLGAQILQAFGGESPDALVVFASSRFDYSELLSTLDRACSPRCLVGASSAGEFVHSRRGEGMVSALAIRSDELRFASGLGCGVSQSRQQASADVVRTFRGLGDDPAWYRNAVVLTDALAGHADELVESLTLATAGRYQFAGGGAGDDARFARTHVFHGTGAYNDAVVGLEILSRRPVGIGVGHGWTPASVGFRVTEVDGARVVSLNGLPAAEVFEEHAERNGQKLDRATPLPFFLHNILGIETGAGYRLRVPLAIDAGGGVTCAAEVPSGATVFIMKTTSDTAIAAAASATQAALRGLHGGRPQAALFFDCVATRLRMGNEFGFELDSVTGALGGADLVGCNTYGQIARSDGQFSGFHNCTAVAMILPGT